MKLCPKCQKHFSDDANFCPVDAARLLPLDAAQGQGSDTLAARFELGEKIGGGRTGAVYRATEKQGGRAVVIKLVAPAVTALPGVAQRLERELKQLERVQSAGVTKLYASGKRDDQTWLALEPLRDAHTLADAITARGPIDLAGAAQLIEVIGEALIEAAQVGVVHRDLAPKNVLFAGDQVKLINFSLPVPTTDKVPGVPEFVAPEQVDGKPVDQRSNLYSLGALYYYVLTGEPPFSGDTAAVHAGHASGTIKLPSQLAAVPAAVEAVIMRALDRSPTKRFLTVRQFVDEVGRIARAPGDADLRSTQPMGKAGKRKAELVQTLLGVRSSPAGAPVAVVASAPSVPTVVVASTPSAPVVVAAAAAAPAPVVVVAPTPAPAPVVVPESISTAPTVETRALAADPAPVADASPAGTVQERSPWAPKKSEPIIEAPVVAAPVVAAPVVAAPVVAAPVVAAPVVAGAAAGKKKADDGEPAKKGRFRETMWFKKGEMDSAAASAAAEQRAATGKDVGTDKADSLPIDERYKDDGSLSRGDKEKYSLRTGGTQAMDAVRDNPGASMSNRVSEDALIDEMKHGRRKVFIAIGVAVIAIGGIVIGLLLH